MRDYHRRRKAGSTAIIIIVNDTFWEATLLDSHLVKHARAKRTGKLENNTATQYIAVGNEPPKIILQIFNVLFVSTQMYLPTDPS